MSLCAMATSSAAAVRQPTMLANIMFLGRSTKATKMEMMRPTRNPPL